MGDHRGRGRLPMTRPLSKSKLIAFRQCPKRLWLEVHHPEWREDSAATQAIFASGHEVGELAQRIFDPDGTGHLIDLQALGVKAALEKTTELLQAPHARAVFEAGFSVDPAGNGGVLAFADILLPEPLATNTPGKPRAWHMIEVKSSTSVKDYYRDDAAIQHYTATQAGLNLASIAIAVIDNRWVYQGDGNYQGLFRTEDLTAASIAQAPQVQEWVAQAQALVQQAQPPQCPTGPHCDSPFACGFYTYCATQEGRLNDKVAHPVHWLPYARIAAWEAQASCPVRPLQSMQDVPDHLLNPVQQRVKQAHQNDEPYIDWQGLQQALAPHNPNPAHPGQSAYFLDFETVMPAIPVWAGTRPYETILTQYSCHEVKADGSIIHREFLNTGGHDPRLGLAQHLLETLGETQGMEQAGRGAIFTYSAYERTQLNNLAQALPMLRPALEQVMARLVDLLPIARQYLYHPAQKGSWSIKSVLPALLGTHDPSLSYERLDQAGHVANGGDAQQAFMEAIAPNTPRTRRQALHEQLLVYCQLDTYAMVRLWQVFTGQSPMAPSPSPLPSSKK